MIQLKHVKTRTTMYLVYYVLAKDNHASSRNIKCLCSFPLFVVVSFECLLHYLVGGFCFVLFFCRTMRFTCSVRHFGLGQTGIKFSMNIYESLRMIHDFGEPDHLCLNTNRLKTSTYRSKCQHFFLNLPAGLG